MNLIELRKKFSTKRETNPDVAANPSRYVKTFDGRLAAHITEIEIKNAPALSFHAERKGVFTDGTFQAGKWTGWNLSDLGRNHDVSDNAAFRGHLRQMAVKLGSASGITALILIHLSETFEEVRAYLNNEV